MPAQNAPPGWLTTTSANKESAAVGYSGTVMLPSTAVAGTTLARAAHQNARRLVKPSDLPAANKSQVAKIAKQPVTERAVSSVVSKTRRAPPRTQKGKGSQLEPLG